MGDVFIPPVTGYQEQDRRRYFATQSLIRDYNSRQRRCVHHVRAVPYKHSVARIVHGKLISHDHYVYKSDRFDDDSNSAENIYDAMVTDLGPPPGQWEEGAPEGASEAAEAREILPKAEIRKMPQVKTASEAS